VDEPSLKDERCLEVLSPSIIGGKIFSAWHEHIAGLDI
jgi:hypothetical protein